jgi:hypothetical protein
VGGTAVAEGGSTGFWYGLLVALGTSVAVGTSVGTRVSVGRAVAVSAGSGVDVAAGIAVRVGGIMVGTGVTDCAVVAVSWMVLVVVTDGVAVFVGVVVREFIARLVAVANSASCVAVKYPLTLLSPIHLPFQITLISSPPHFSTPSSPISGVSPVSAIEHEMNSILMHTRSRNRVRIRTSKRLQQSSINLITRILHNFHQSNLSNMQIYHIFYIFTFFEPDSLFKKQSLPAMETP